MLFCHPQIPQLILPEPAISISMPTPPKLGPTVKWEGSPNIIPTVSLKIFSHSDSLVEYA